MRRFAKYDHSQPKPKPQPIAPKKPASQPKPAPVAAPARAKAKPAVSATRATPNPTRTTLPQTATNQPARKPAGGIKSDYDRIWNATKSTRDDFIKQTERVKGESAKKKEAPAKKTPADKLKNKWSRESKKVYSK